MLIILDNPYTGSDSLNSLTMTAIIGGVSVAIVFILSTTTVIAVTLCLRKAVCFSARRTRLIFNQVSLFIEIFSIVIMEQQ